MMVGGDDELSNRLKLLFERSNRKISAPVVTESLIRHLRSREENYFMDRMISIMRGAFGGHDATKS